MVIDALLSLLRDVMTTPGFIEQFFGLVSLRLTRPKKFETYQVTCYALFSKESWQQLSSILTAFIS